VGYISAIDLNQVRIDVTRAASAAAAARAAEADAILLLKRLLRSQSFAAVQGTLDLPRPPAEDSSRAALERRPDLAALAAESRAADAEAELGRALARPELGARLGYQRDDGDSIVVGGLTITLPAFQRGQGLVAAGRARAARAKVEIEMAREHALVELDRAYAAYLLQQRAAELASAGLTAVDDNENLARRSYEAGEMGLLDYLLIRRDAFQTRTAVVDRRLEVARSRITIDFISGVLR
jgi:outer membrane protein, heavy metal efflux system